MKKKMNYFIYFLKSTCYLNKNLEYKKKKNKKKNKKKKNE